ncbi:MAG TPA: NAD(P)/FAD-dependent oxidoreductase [Candidatus Latescibacteria bacterium]|nr:NAD(P)/FAD-dependent oxidoreductase [Candidatus Handelsmanbacteria bacterium]HIL08718.1 NAD(P)/FAD-dependent oxidoreductase [Candidatus Latescibacterota bacterium]
MTNASAANDSYDVVVAGGGPAGATLAAFLARAGYRCLIFERAKFPRYHIGESLIPQTYGTLDRLGLLPKLRASNFPQKHSVRFVSPTGRVSSPFYFSDRIQGEGAQTWQVERGEFDRMMLDHAREQGVEVREETRVEEVLFAGERAVGLRAVREGAQAYEIDARIVVDASGGATLIGRQLGLRGDVPGLVKASIWTYYRGGARLEGIDAGETTIFHIGEGGWFWYIPLPDDLVSVGIVASPEYLFAQTEEKEAIFLGEVERCAPLKERLARAEHVGPVRGYRQLAYANRQTSGAGWLMVGDARAFLDPIYSSGLFLALASAELAAECACEALAADDLSAARLGRFEPELTAGVEVIRRLIHAFYDPQFSFGAFVERFPGQRGALIDCLTGDVLDKDMSPFLAALAQMTSPPEPF